MRILSLFILVGGLVGLAQPALSAGKTRAIQFPGFTEGTMAKIYQRIPNLKDGNWQALDLDLLVQHLVREEQYDTASVVQLSEIQYKVVVGRVRRIATLDFKGSDSVSETELRRQTGLSEKTPFDPGVLVEAGEKIRSYYESLGFPKTQVDLQYKESTKTEVAISVVVREGPQTLMDDFKVTSPNPELQRVLLNVLKHYRKSPLMQKTLVEIRNQAREKLSAAGFWRTELPSPTVSLNFEESKAVLTFDMKNSDQYFLETEGNKREDKPSISKFLSLDTYFSTNPNLSAELGSRVRSFYLSRGYARAEVQAEEVVGARPYTRKVVLKIQEGPVVKIEKFEISGFYSLPSDFYVNFIKSHASEQISRLHYVKDDLDQALKNLVTDRWNQGFLRAKLVSTRTVYSKERDKVTILINLDEGPLTQVEKITFNGNSSLGERELLEVVNLEAGKPLRLNALDEAVLKLKEHYQDRGFLEVQLLNEKEGLVTYNADNTLVYLNFQISEGPRVRVASILIEGNSITHEDVILKELEFKKGEFLTPKLIDESTSRLQRLGHFSLIEIKTLEEKTPISERTVVIKVIDRDPGLFNFGAGVTNERGFTVRGYTGLAYRNIGGTGRGISARVDANYNVDDVKYLENKVTLGYLEPYLLDTRTRGRLNLTRSNSVSDFDKRQASLVTQTTWSLEQDVTSHLLVIWDVLSMATVSDFYIDTNQPTSLLSIGSSALTVDVDYRNHPFNPSRGTFTRLNTEYGCPALGSTDTIEYSRSFGSFTHYYPLTQTGTFVWANSVRAGHLRNLSPKQNGSVPFDKKGFILGGQGTVRGFSPDEAFPNAKDFMAERFEMKTSATMSLIKSELRFPLWGNFGGALFYDGGMIQIHGNAFESGWRDSVGIAARYVTPVGAVSLEYGWKRRPRGDRNESPSVFHFSIGTF